MPRRSVVITGVGPITAFGLGIDPLWQALIEGRSAIRRITRFDASTFPCGVAAELGEELFSVRSVVPRSYRKATKVMARDIELAVGAALAAVQDAGLTTHGTDPDQTPTIPPERFGCHVGSGLIAADIDELTAALITSRDANGGLDLKRWGSAGMQELTPLWMLKYLPNMLSCHVTIIHNCQGPSNAITCMEASAGLSVGESMRVIERRAADACLSGGVEDRENPMGLLRQAFSGRTAPVAADDDPTRVVRPFDPSATGTVLGSGGGIVVLEAEETAAARHATPYCQVAGFASSHSFCPDTIGLEIDPDDDGMDAAMENALADAGLPPEEIDAIVPLGSGIPIIDRAEAASIHRVFGDRAGRIPVVTVVPSVGSCCAGAGGVSLSVAAKMIREQRLPARLNTSGATTLDANVAPARDATLDAVLVFTPSFGGQNAALVLKRI